MQALTQHPILYSSASAGLTPHNTGSSSSSSRISSSSGLPSTPLVSLSWRSSVGGRVSRCLPTEHHLTSARPKNVIRASSTSEAASTSTAPAPAGYIGMQAPDDRVKHVTSIEQFEEALRTAKNKLVVVEYAASNSKNSRRIYPSMVDLSKTLKGVVFLLVLGDESDETKELCERAGIEKVPHFVFYKHSKMIHEEQGITSDQLEGDVLYYGDNDAPIHQVRNLKDYDVLLEEHASDGKLVVLDIGLRSCGPCVKIYPTFVSLSKRMFGNTVFARMDGDENEECQKLLKSLDVVEVPTFVFLRDGKTLGRYVGSGRGELVGEILRYNGVKVT